MRRLTVGLSASECDVYCRGFTNLHFEASWLRTARLLFLADCTINFGGDLRPGGLTEILLDIIRDFGGREGEPLHCHLALPIHQKLDLARGAKLMGLVKFHEYTQPSSTAVSAVAEATIDAATPEAMYLWARSLTRMRAR